MKEVLRKLPVQQSGLVGCPRRNRWSETTYKGLTGVALLEYLAQRYIIKTPVGPQEVFVRDNQLVVFVGGKYRAWYTDDLHTLYDLVRVYSDLDLSDEIQVIQEYRGRLSGFIVNAPSAPAGTLAQKALNDYLKEPPGRIRKDEARAYKTCPTCPAKARCDAADRERGETADWGASYPFP